MRRAGNIVVGGGSRVGGSVASILAGDVRVISREVQSSLDELIVADYADIAERDLEGATTLVNCVGISDGNVEQMRLVNVELPVQLAVRAKAAGVRQFIHISSFSVYGHTPLIDSRSHPRPRSIYGQSKLEADEALLALSDAEFAITILRLPLIYAPGTFGKLGRLIVLWKKLRVFPVPSADVQRAMISAEMTANVIARIVAAPLPGVHFAADPKPFTYQGAALVLGGELIRLRLPRFITNVICFLAPAFGNRVFASCALAETDNLAVRFGIASTLYKDISAKFAQ